MAALHCFLEQFLYSPLSAPSIHGATGLFDSVGGLYGLSHYGEADRVLSFDLTIVCLELISKEPLLKGRMNSLY